MSSGHILIVEDEKKIADVLTDYLENDGHTVTVIDRGDRVIPAVRESPPDLMLLDIMLPGMDGLSVCRALRKFSDLPVIMLTAKVEEADRLMGLELGSDDYICKPFSPREVVARVRAVLRRTAPKSAPEDRLMAGPLALSPETRKVTAGEQALPLTPSEFGLLEVFMRHPDRVYSRNELLNQVQGYDFDGYDRTIDTHIKNLRKKIAAALPGRNLIRSVYGVGYKLDISES